MLCDNYSAIIYGSITQVVNDAAVAENLLKETFKKICTSINQYNQNQLTFLSWALQLARSVSIDYLCITQKKDLLVSSPKKSVLQGRVELLILPLADKVNDDCKVFNLILQGFKANQIAEKLGMTIEAVKINIRKGMKLKANVN